MTTCRRDGRVPNDRRLHSSVYGTLDDEPMTLSRTTAGLVVFLTLITGLTVPASVATSDDLRQSPRVGALRIPLTSYERIPIGTVLAHPDRYQMREIRLAGTVTAIQTETITNRMICGSAHERTTLMVEDDSGQIEVVDQGACGKNLSTLKAPMVQVGEQIDLLVLIMVTTNRESREAALEATIRFLNRARD